jgi:tripartite-type tricarboxylate transporter receptor subunit TctC
MTSRRRFLGHAASLAAWPALPLSSHGAETTAPTQVIVGFPPGGPVDIAARLVGPLLSARLGELLEVVNLPSESGNIATARVVAAQPDGRTLLMSGPVNAINTTLFPKLPFDFGQDLAAVAGLYSVPLVVEVHPEVPAQSVAEFIRLARSRPGELRVGYAGVGTPQHVGIELFNVMAGVSLKLVPYAGSAPALVDLLAGRLDAMFDPTPSSIEHLRAGQLRALAVTGKMRLSVLPDVPIVADDVPGYEAGSWFGLCAPRSTPQERIEALNAAANDALRDRALQLRLNALGAQAMPGSPADFAELIAGETRKYARVIEAAGIKARS